MAGVKPFFITGANAKIKINGKTLAFCTDLSYSIQIAHQTPKVLGMYEGSSVEPLGYTVSGSFSVIRYTKDASMAVGADSTPYGISENDAGNGVGNMGSVWGGKFGDFLNRNGIGNDGRTNEALNPSLLSNGTTFDIQVYQKVPGQGGEAGGFFGAAQRTINAASDILTGGTGVNGSAPGLIGVANIRNCRITQADFSISKRGAAMQRFNFVALYADEDSFVADFSGVGQQFEG